MPQSFNDWAAGGGGSVQQKNTRVQSFDDWAKTSPVTAPPKRKTVLDSLKEYGSFAGNTVANTYKQIGGGAVTAAKQVPKLPEAINNTLGVAVGGLGGAVATAASPLFYGASRAMGRSHKQALDDSLSTISETAKKGYGVGSQAIPGSVAALGEAGKTGYATARGYKGVVTNNQADMQYFYNQAKEKLRQYTTMGTQATGKPAPTDQELDAMLQTKSGQLAAAGAIDFDLYILASTARAVKSSLLDKSYRYVTKKEIVPGKEYVNPDGTTGYKPVDVAPKGFSRKPMYADSKYYNIDGYVGETSATGKPINLLRVTPTNKGSQIFEVFQYRRPLSPVKKYDAPIGDSELVKQLVSGADATGTAAAASKTQTTKLIDTAKEQAAMQAEHGGRADVAKIIRETNTTGINSIGEAETKVMRAVGDKVDPKFMKQVVTPYFRSEQQVGAFPTIEMPSPAIQKVEGRLPTTTPPAGMSGSAPITSAPIIPAIPAVQPSAAPAPVATPAPTAVPNTTAPLPQIAHQTAPVSTPTAVSTSPTTTVSEPSVKPQETPVATNTATPSPVTSPVSTPTNPAEIPTHTKYFIQNPKQVNPDGSAVFTEVSANKVEILPNVDTFITRNPNGQGFVVAEGQTGLAIAEGNTKEQAASNAVQTLLSKTDQIQKVIKDQVTLRGSSPRYTMASSLAAPETKTTVIRYKNEKITLPPGITADEMRNIVDFAGSDLNLRQKMVDAANLKQVRVSNVQKAAPKEVPDQIRAWDKKISSKFEGDVAKEVEKFVKMVGPKVLSHTKVELVSGKGMASYVLGETYQKPMESIVKLYTDIMKSEGKEGALKVTIHEFWHAISRYMPKEDVAQLKTAFETERNQWLKGLGETQRNAFLKARRLALQGKEVPDELLFNVPSGSYQYLNLDEYVAVNFTKRTLADLQAKAGYKGFWGKLAELMRSILDAVKRLINRFNVKQDVKDKIYDNFLAKRYSEFRPDSGSLRQMFNSGFEKKIEPTDLKSIKVPMPKGLFADDAALERDVYENGYDVAKHQVVMKNGDVVLGGEVLRGLQRRSAKGLDVPEKIDVVQMTPEINPPPTASEITKNLNLPPEQSKGLTVMEQKSNEYAARAELNPKEAAELTAQLIMGKKNWATILADEKVARHVTQPHIRFKGELWDVMHEGYYYQQIAEVTWKKRLDNVFKKMGVREGSKKEKMLEEWRNYYDPKNSKRPTDIQIEELIKMKKIKYRADQIPEKVRALSDRFTELFTDPIREYAINQGLSMGRRGGYVPRVKLPDAIARFEGASTDLSFNDWMTKENRDPTIDARSSLKRKMYSYVDMLTKKIYLEPKLQDADALATKIYENDAMKLQEAKKWVQYVRSPYEMEGSVVGQRATQVARITSSMARQWIASADLGIRSGLKNIAWGGSMLYGKHGNLMWKSMAKLMTPSGMKIVSEHAPHLTSEVLPLITGTFGTKVEGSIRVFSNIQRRFMPSGILQVAGENILRPWSYLTGWMDGEAKGLTGRELELYAHQSVVETQQLYTPLDMQPLFRGQAGSIAGQFVASPMKQQIEILSNIKNKRFMNFGRWLAASIAFFFFLSWMWPKKRLATKDGSKYWSSEIDPWQGIDIWGIHQAWKYRKEVGYFGAAQMVGEQFIAPFMKLAAHIGGYTFKSDEVFSQYSTQLEIIGKDVGYPQRAVVKDIKRVAEVFGAQVSDDDTRYLSTALGVSKMLSEAKDDATRAKISKEYSDFVPLVDDAQSTYGELNSIKGSYSAQKSAIKKNPEYSESTKKQLTDELTNNYLDDKRNVMHRFNQLIANQIKQ